MENKAIEPSKKSNKELRDFIKGIFLIALAIFIFLKGKEIIYFLFGLGILILPTALSIAFVGWLIWQIMDIFSGMIASKINNE